MAFVDIFKRKLGRPLEAAEDAWVDDLRKPAADQDGRDCSRRDQRELPDV